MLPAKTILYPQYCFLQWKSHLVWIRREICTNQAQFTSERAQKQSKRTCGWILMWDNRRWTFTGGRIINVCQKQWFEAEEIHLNAEVFSLHETLIDVWVDLDYDVLSVVWTLILTAPIHCRASIAEQVMQCYISPNLMKKQTHPYLGWLEDEYIYNFWVNYFNAFIIPASKILNDYSAAV